MKWLTRLGLSAFTFVLGGLVVGLGGQAHAQQIPAPDLYDGATDCTTGVTSVIRPPLPGAMSTLDTALTGFGSIDTSSGANARLVGVVEAGTACDDNAVGSEFDAAKRLYDDAAAAKTLASGDDPDPLAVADYATKKAARDDFGGAVYEALYTQYDRQATARKAITDYNAVVADTTGTFTVAKGRYDALIITPTNTNLIAYVPDDPATAGTDEEVLGTYGGRGTVAGFRDIGGTGLFTAVGDDATTAAVAAGEFSSDFVTALDTAFTTGGTLRLATTGSGATAIPTVSTDTTTLGEIANYLTHWNNIVDTATRHVAEGTRNEVTNLAELQETLRRVTAARDHVAREQRRLVNVLRAVNYEYDHDADGGTTPEVSVSSVLREFDTELAKRTSAANTVRSAVTALENARNAIHTAMRNPGTFLQQVVDLRQYQKDAADTQVAEFGDDVPDSVTRAAMNAATALTNAQDALNEHTALVGDADNPASALLNALLEDPMLPNGTPNPADDDGQALINAISTTYSAAEDAATAAGTAETAANAASDAVAALTAMDDPETEADETGAVTANSNAIAGIQADLTGLTGEDGQVGTNTSDIADLDGRVTTNEETLVDHGEKLAAKKMYIETLAAEIGVDPVTGMGTGENGMSRIDMNAAGVASNADNISMNATNISMNADNISMNATNISMNADNIATNAGAIATNAGAIATNAGNIATNATAIADEESARMAADTMLMGHVTTNADNISANAGNIMANAGNIAANASEIMTNAGNIVSNAGNIATNVDAIAANNMYIMENRGMIETNAGMIGANANAIGANTAAIAAANSRIDANAMAVRELREDMSGGIAAAMALAGMPEIGDRGFSVGAGSYDGESAVAVGVHFSGENSRFKAAITSGGGETGVSVGGGWSF